MSSSVATVEKLHSLDANAIAIGPPVPRLVFPAASGCWLLGPGEQPGLLWISVILTLLWAALLAGARAVGECGGHLRHPAGQEADDRHRAARSSAGVSGKGGEGLGLWVDQSGCNYNVWDGWWG